MRIRLKLPITAIITVLLAVAASCSLLAPVAAHAGSQFMGPQSFPEKGPWFEGWYYRLTDVEQKRSFTILVGRTAAKGTKILSHQQKLGGYVAYLLKPASHAPTESYEAFPSATWIEGAGSDFEFKAEGFGSLSENQVQMKLPGGDEVSIQLGERKPWSTDLGSWGPAGFMSYLKIMPLFWWVESLGSPATYTIKRKSGEVLTGRAFAHLEKNWGLQFPKAWFWTQAVSDDGQSQLVLSGGPVRLGPLTMTSYLIGYRSKKYSVDMRPDQMLEVRYEREYDPIAGTFSMHAENSEYSLIIRAKADPKSFAMVSVPTEKGFARNGGKESFSATVQVDLWQRGVHLERQVFEGAALEFGGEFMTGASRY